jgi:T5orf172 domain
MSNPTEGYVYLGQADHLYKIGASKQPAMRAIQLQNDATIRPKNISGDVSIKWKLWVKNYKLIERILHTRFASRQVIGEWFALTQTDLDGATLIRGG